MGKKGKKKGNTEQEAESGPSQPQVVVAPSTVPSTISSAPPSAASDSSQQADQSQPSRKGKPKFKKMDDSIVGNIQSTRQDQGRQKPIQEPAQRSLNVPLPVKFQPTAQAPVQQQPPPPWGKRGSTPAAESQPESSQQVGAPQQLPAPWGKRGSTPAAEPQPQSSQQVGAPQQPPALWGKRGSTPAAEPQPQSSQQVDALAPQMRSLEMSTQAPPGPQQVPGQGKKKNKQKGQGQVPQTAAVLPLDVAKPEVIPQQLQQQSQKSEQSKQPWQQNQQLQQQPPQHQPLQHQLPQQQPAQRPQQSPQQQQQPAQPPQKQQQKQPQQPKQPQTPAPASPASRASPPGGGLMVPVRKNQPRSEKKGRPITVETNYLPIEISKTIKEVIHYDVAIDPDKPKKFMFPAVLKFLEKNFPGRFPAFDGQKNLYSINKLPMKSDILCDTIFIPEEGRKDPLKFEVTVKYAARVDMSLLNTYMNTGVTDNIKRAIQCMDIVLRHSSHFRNGFVKVGRSFFVQPSGNAVSLGGGLELWHGIYQSAVLGWKPFINVDITNKGFPKRQNVLDLINELNDTRDDVMRSARPLDQRIIDNLKKYVKGLKVEYEVPGTASTKRSYRVNDVVESPDCHKFKMDDGRVMTVTDYFLRERRYKLRYPNFPCLWVGSRTSERKIYYPVELCTILPGQVIIRKMDAGQTTKMIGESASPADIRKQKVMKAIESMKYNQDPTVKEFGIHVTEKFQAVDARVITPPILEYKDKFQVTPRDGQWRGAKFLNSATLSDWIVLILDRTPQPAAEDFVMMLISAGNKAGMAISRPRSIRKIEKRDLDPVMMTAKQDKVQLVVAIIGSYGDDYARVKQTAELKYGVLTQCIKGNTVGRFKPTTAEMLLLKVNAKLNCVNHKMFASITPNCLKRPCMIVGADVTHPSPGQMNEPSIAAVAASHHISVFPYNICLRLQPPKMEIIEDFGDMIKEQLIFFRSKTNWKPEHIIIFRDGVSDGQFESVLNSELMAIRGACSTLEADYQPKISFFVVQKRHHTRFFPTDKRDADRNYNVPAGTCVDTVITHPTEMDFYLLSHASIRGTARPTRYHCLWDDADMKESEVEELAYYLCHMFTRCNRAVSYPAPTYYAHLAAARAKVLVEGCTIDMDNLNYEQRKLKVVEEIIKEKPMFFV